MRTRQPRRWLLALAAIALPPVVSDAGAVQAARTQVTAAGTAAGVGPVHPAVAAVPGLSYRFEKVADGVFCAIASGVPYYVANAVVVVGEDGLLLVDPGPGPDEARVLREAIRSLSDRPVRYVVDTHGHFDHALGNGAFPGAVVVAHQATRQMLGRDAMRLPTVANYLAGLPAQVAKAEADAAAEADAGKRAALEQRATSLAAYERELQTLVSVPPAVTFESRMTLWLGDREVRLLHLGRGHTAGDVVVLLPKEHVLCTGDLFNGYIGFMGDAYVGEWATALEHLAALDFETVVAGHGPPFRGKDRIAPVQACLRDLWRQAEALHREGVAADAAAARIDLRAHAAQFPRFAQVGFEALALRRIYAVIEEQRAKP